MVRHGADLRYCGPLGGWFTWDGRRWLRDTTGEIDRRAKETVVAIYEEAAKARNNADREALAKHAIASQRRQAIAAMIALAQSELEVVAVPGDFDRDPWLLTVNNGTLDLRLDRGAGQLMSHRPEDLITKLAPVTFDPSAKAPRFHQFIAEVLNGDTELTAFTQRVAGLSLTGITWEQYLYLLWGFGQNGKGAYIRTLEALLGDYFTKADFSTFAERPNDTVRNDVAALAGARLVAAEEARDGRRLAEGLVKNLTGQDTITARHLYREEFRFKPTFKIILSTNEKPRITGTDFGIWRRILLVPFTVRVTPDRTLEPVLQGLELPGILNWAIEGCLAWQRHGLNIPASVRAATETYRAEQDVLSEYLEECCEVVEGATERATALFQAYQEWAERHRLRERDRLTMTAFGRALSDRGFGTARTSKGLIDRRGLMLRPLSNGECPMSTSDGPHSSDGLAANAPLRPRVSDLPKNHPNCPNGSYDAVGEALLTRRGPSSA